MTTKVGSYPANPWGDLHGNVSEWVEDCWNESYDGAPEDGTAWTSGDCGYRVTRGGGWEWEWLGVRSASREAYPIDHRDIADGFRLARTLSRSESVTLDSGFVFPGVFGRSLSRVLRCQPPSRKKNQA